VKKINYLSPVFAVLGVIVVAIMITGAAPALDKLRPDEIVSKHLASIGSPEALSSIKTRITVGNVTVTFRMPGKGKLAGKAVLASDGGLSVVGMNFDDSRYSQERFGFDGQAVTAAFVRPGMRSSLGDFLLTHQVVFKQGLIGGTLSSAWPLFNLNDKNGKLEYGGTRKIDGIQAYQLNYMPRGGSDLEISLYFDAENFHHLRTEYTRAISAQIGVTDDTSGHQRESRYKMVESFSNFKKEGLLTLPHNYKLELQLETRADTYAADWEFTFSEFSFNQPIEPGSFKVSD